MTREYKKPRSIRRHILGLTFGRLCVVSLLGYSFEDAISKPVECGKMLNGKTWKENIGA